MITAKELREQLKDIPDDVKIILQTDDEGNGYRYIRGIDYEADGDNVNYFNGEDCIRREDLEAGWGFTDGEDYAEENIVAVIF